MKNYNEKIQKFLKWMEDGDNGNYRFIIPNRDAFELYKMENPEVEELSIDEGKYIDMLYKVTLQNGAATNQIKGDISKLCLGNDFGYVERPKEKETGPIEYVIFDTSGLMEENTAVHENENFENDAIKGDL